jgi:uncharacterized protein (TIGR03083 family)
LVETGTYLQCIADDAARIVDIGRHTPLDTAVPSCPDWTLRDLIVHVGIVHRHKAETVAGGWVDASPARPLSPGESDDLLAWFADGVELLLDVLGHADLSQPSWTWCGHEHTAAWWVRRMAHETAVHRADAELAAGIEPDLDADLGADGVDEILDEMMVGGPGWGTVIPGSQVILLEAADRAWRLRTASFVGTSPTTGTSYDMMTLIHDPGAEPDVVIATDPSTMDLWLWGRAVLPDGAVTGDGELAEQVRTLAAEATQ